MKKYLLLLCLTNCFLQCGTTTNYSPSSPEIDRPPRTFAEKPKNLILMIGDGMGLTQITAGIYDNNNFLNLERFPVTGLMKTHSADNLVTDSAASATAMACGVKTYNGAIGMNKDGIPVKSILEEAEEKKMATGMVVTSTVVHATPGSFVAHQKLRAFFEPIADDLTRSGIDFFVGGGKKYFDRRDSDERNLYKELEEKGYQMSDFLKDRRLDKIVFEEGKNFGYFTADDDPLTKITGRDYLPEASLIGAKFLENRSEQGFFMLIEGSQIDWGGHAANKEFVLTELKDFDDAVKKILDFAEENGETLVVVTADHETGGMSVNEGTKMGRIKTSFAHGRHTGTMVPVFAYGPGAEIFTGVYDNTQLNKKMKRVLGLDAKQP